MNTRDTNAPVTPRPSAAPFPPPPAAPPDPALLPESITFFLTRRDRQRVLRRLAAPGPRRTAALLRALGLAPTSRRTPSDPPSSPKRAFQNEAEKKVEAGGDACPTRPGSHSERHTKEKA